MRSRDGFAAERFFRKVLKTKHAQVPRVITESITAKRDASAAKRFFRKTLLALHTQEPLQLDFCMKVSGAHKPELPGTGSRLQPGVSF